MYMYCALYKAIQVSSNVELEIFNYLITGRFYTNKEDKKGSHREMKNKEQILKARRKKSKLQAFQKKRQQIKNKRRSMSGRGK